FKVNGQTKINGEKYPWDCEVKDRHVTTVNFSGLKPEGLGTAEKFAIGAAASAVSKDQESEPVAETAAPPEVRARSSGEMDGILADGCTVLYDDFGLRAQKGASCSADDLKQTEKATTAHLNSGR
ncbi:MAG: hypothetical protein WBM40_15255, partial [Thiohalocapsa sp.]